MQFQKGEREAGKYKVLVQMIGKDKEGDVEIDNGMFQTREKDRNMIVTVTSS